MDKGRESGSGMISSGQGVGSGSSRSLSPWKEAPCALPMLYCTGSVKFVSLGGDSEYTYKSLCEDPELVVSIEILLFKNAYKNEPTPKRNDPIPELTSQIHDSVPCSIGNILDRVESIIHLVN